jgi:phosphatidylserine decarboxylase
MSIKSLFKATFVRPFQQDNLNFLLTNRLPRALVTRLVGRIAKVEQPVVRDLSLAVWQLFADLDLSEAARSEFRSLNDCFTRELKPGARPVDPDPAVLVSPCDALVGACGPVRGEEVLQVKDSPYTLSELLVHPSLVDRYRNGTYVTLRLTSSMYHRFHAPADGRVTHVTYVSGDTWNTNPITVKRVERLFCKNERAIVQLALAPQGSGSANTEAPVLTLVAVASILVASIRLHGLDPLLHLGYQGPRELPCDRRFARGEEMGWFELGSTIVVLAPPGFALCDGLGEGTQVKMGERLLRAPR